ncbi:hypothetical protein O1611_g1030 [Lasiodiplodia mahajangana]|uniref:Uncharacterized protein n=1 Tax=Lasiodiplodia mahajangana TaxID=1108764 RepID=A0ACC2JYP1_9PEZI|nr:hypothetical protein O1611_g1030 [Lasiodiplodia mahajangana]
MKLQSLRALAPSEVYLVQDRPPHTLAYDNTQLDSTKLLPVANNSAIFPSPVGRMKAFPQRPGPGGSRVVKKRPSTPNLGDGLLTALTCDATFPRSTMHAKSEVATTLTSSNLSQLAKSTHLDGDFIVVGTPSTCSDDDDVVLIGTPSLSMNSKSSSRLSSQLSTPRGDETPPTTLNGDESFFSSDGETALELPSYTPSNDELVSRPQITPFALNGAKGAATDAKRQSPASISYSNGGGSPHGTRPRAHSLTRKLPDLPEPTLGYGSIGTPDIETIPSAESLHGIVRGFFAVETSVKSPSPSITSIQEHTTLTSIAASKSKPFWDPQRIFEFYISGAITPDKAKETAKRNGLVGVIPVIDSAEALKKENPSLHVADVITKAANEGNLGILRQSTQSPTATPERKQHGSIYDNFMLKLKTYSEHDDSISTAKPLHIFVDMSNIHIGFCNSWKISQNIPIDRRVRAPAFNFKILTSIMERNRPAKKKVLASSVPSHVVSRTQWPQHFVDAEKQGYKTSILSRVQKLSPVKHGRRRKTTPQGPAITHPTNMVTSGDESAEDTGRPSYETRNGEQGVDEILHLNMMNSILDNMQEPGTMILATGDAAQAEFSEGFLEYASRALSQGWNLELVTWKATISSAWMNPVFRTKYGERFRIIYLDDFLGELNADLCPSLT